MKLNTFSKAISIIIFLTTVLITNVPAQSDKSRVSGNVSDSNGAAIAGAVVTVTNEKTGETRTVTTKSDGTFQIIQLNPTAYTVSATADNFETAKRTAVQLLVGQEATVDLVLQAKGVTVQVDVTSTEDAAINISSASMSANVNPREVNGLPLNGRQVSQLYLQAPGAVNSGSGTFCGHSI